MPAWKDKFKTKAKALSFSKRNNSKTIASGSASVTTKNEVAVPMRLPEPITVLNPVSQNNLPMPKTTDFETEGDKVVWDRSSAIPEPQSEETQQPASTSHSADLWEKALEELDENDCAKLKSFRESKASSGNAQVRTNVDSVLAHVNTILLDESNKKWKSVLNRVLDGTQKFNALVDSGLKFDISGYGAIVWSVLSFGLKMAINAKELREIVLQSSELIAQLVARYAAYEVLYRGSMRKSRTSEAFEGRLIEVYKAVLVYIVSLEGYLQKSGPIHFAKGFVPAPGRTISNNKKSIEKADNGVKELLPILKAESDSNSFSKLESQIETLMGPLQLLDKRWERIQGEVGGLREDHKAREYASYLAILRTSNYMAIKDLNPQPVPGTCEWFLEHKKYLDWISPHPTSNLLWVSADPGCGKSVLAKSMVDQFAPGMVIYYFFKYDIAEGKSATHAVCALLHQICSARIDLIHHVLPVLQKNGDKITEFSLFEELWSAFSSVIQDLEIGGITIILDALDECSSSERHNLLERLAQAASSLSSPAVKFLVTSRPYSSIHDTLFDETSLDECHVHLAGENAVEKKSIQKEIKRVIRVKIDDFQRRRVSKGMFDDAHIELESHLSQYENKTYLWVSAIFARITSEIRTPKWRLLEIVKDLPDDVDNAYESILHQSRDKERLRKILQILLVAEEPLTLDEMNAALHVPSDPSKLESLQSESAFQDDIRDLCGFFINVIKGKIYFVHQTAKEFLLHIGDDTAIEGWKHSFKARDANTAVARICVNYLLLFDSGFEEFQKMDLVSATDINAYMEVMWPKAENASRCLKENGLYTWWTHKSSFSAEDSSDEDPSDEDPSDEDSSAAVSTGEGWSSEDTDDNSHYSDAERLKPFRYGFFKHAAKNWHVYYERAYKDPRMVKESRKLCASMSNIWRTWHICDISEINHYGYPDLYRLYYPALGDDLSFHSTAGNISALDTIVNNDNNDAYLNYSEDQKTFALLCAVSSKEPDAVSLLLQKGINPNSQLSFETRPVMRRTALLCAADLDFGAPETEETVKIVQLLLKHSACPNTICAGETAAHIMARSKNTESLRNVITFGADPRILSDNGRSWLYGVADFEHLLHRDDLQLRSTIPKIVELCIKAGVDRDIVDYNCQTALQYAIKRGSETSFEALLNAGCDCTIKDQEGRTALQLVKEVLAGKERIYYQDFNEPLTEEKTHFFEKAKRLLSEKETITSQDDGEVLGN